MFDLNLIPLGKCLSDRYNILFRIPNKTRDEGVKFFFSVNILRKQHTEEEDKCTSFLSSIFVVNVGVPLGFDVLVKLIPLI